MKHINTVLQEMKSREEDCWKLLQIFKQREKKNPSGHQGICRIKQWRARWSAWQDARQWLENAIDEESMDLACLCGQDLEALSDAYRPAAVLH